MHLHGADTTMRSRQDCLLSSCFVCVVNTVDVVYVHPRCAASAVHIFFVHACDPANVQTRRFDPGSWSTCERALPLRAGLAAAASTLQKHAKRATRHVGLRSFAFSCKRFLSARRSSRSHTLQCARGSPRGMFHQCGKCQVPFRPDNGVNV